MTATDTGFIAYSTDEAARLLAGMSRSKLLRLVRDGAIGHMNTGTPDRPTYAFTPDHLRDYAASVSVPPRGHQATLARVAQTVPGEGVVIIDRLKRGEGEQRQVVLLPEVVDTLRDWRAMTSGAGYVFGPHDGLLAGMSRSKLLRLVRDGAIGHMNTGTPDRPTYAFTPDHLRDYAASVSTPPRGT